MKSGVTSRKYSMVSRQMDRCAELAQALWSVRVRWLPWQQLQLVLCCVNNFYGKLSSNVARTIRSNGIDIG